MICPECEGTGETHKCEGNCDHVAEVIITTFTPAFSILVLCRHCAEPYLKKGWAVAVTLNEEGAKI
jgi:hypothetical protein